MIKLKHAIGVDISKDTFNCSYSYFTIEGIVKIEKDNVFSNSSDGYLKFLDWIKEIDCEKIHVGMEATGVYHFDLAFFLTDHIEFVYVINPMYVKNYIKSQGQKTKTDKEDSRIIARYILLESPTLWIKPSDELLTLRSLTRERETYVDLKAQAKNRKHAHSISSTTELNIITRNATFISSLTVVIREIEKQIDQIIASNCYYYEEVKRLETIPGIGPITALTILTETFFFENITSRKQLVSFAGLDVAIKQSGKWNGKPKISKKGNPRIRSVLYFAAISAKIHNPILKVFSKRINDKKAYKGIARVGVMRKLLALSFTLFKNKTVFDPNHMEKNISEEKPTETLSTNQ